MAYVEAMIRRGASLGDHHLKDYWSRNTDRKCPPDGAAKRASKCTPDIVTYEGL